MTSVQNQHIELKIQYKIRQTEDELVTAIEQAFDYKKYGTEQNTKKKDDILKPAQFRNLVRVANTTESPEVIKNFLRYQVGRNNKKWGSGKNSLAEQIISDIDNTLHQKATHITQPLAPNEHQLVWLELIRRYLGYGARYLSYLTNLQRQQTNNQQ